MHSPVGILRLSDPGVLNVILAAASTKEASVAEFGTKSIIPEALPTGSTQKAITEVAKSVEDGVPAEDHTLANILTKCRTSPSRFKSSPF